MFLNSYLFRTTTAYQEHHCHLCNRVKTSIQGGLGTTSYLLR